MLNHPTLDKLLALRLEGMAQALEEQRRQADISQLDFEERFGLLVERQYQLRASPWVANHQNCPIIIGSVSDNFGLSVRNHRNTQGLAKWKSSSLTPIFPLGMRF